MGRPRRGGIKKALLAQMEKKGMTGAHFADLAEDYMAYYDKKQELLNDVDRRGSVVTVTDSKGVPQKRTNQSLLDALKVTKSMNDMLKNLGLNEPDGAGDDDITL